MVSYEAKDKEGKPVKVSYQRSQLSSQSERARYRCARPTPSISSDSACNARPVAGQMPSPRNRGEHSAEDVRRPRDTPFWKTWGRAEMPSVPDAAILPASAHDQAHDRAADRALRLGASGWWTL